MIDEREVRKMLQRRADTVRAAPADTPKAVLRARRRLALNGAVATVAATAVVVAALAGVDAIRTAPVPADTPAPGVMRENGEVLRFTGLLPDGTLGSPGDLVAVDPRTGEGRVLLEDLDTVYSASWSADGRWLAYEIDATDGGGRNLWVIGGSQAPRIVASDDHYPSADPLAELAWKWSPTGAELATIQHSETLRTIDVATGETTDLGTVADVLPGSQPWSWAWSPDGAHIVVGSLEGSLYSFDVRSGERSLLARLPGTVERIRWSPDGVHIAVQTRVDPGGRLYLMDADGSDIGLVADDSNSLGFAWSPDGTRLAFGSEAGKQVRLRIATMDGAAADVGSVGIDWCARTSWGYEKECSVAWSPDGAHVAIRLGEAFEGEPHEATVFDATGEDEGQPLDELTFLAWDGGWYRAPVWERPPP